jgi:hypothetical protein
VVERRGLAPDQQHAAGVAAEHGDQAHDDVRLHAVRVEQ